MGIGEVRWALLEDGNILETRVKLEGIASAGEILEAKLTSVGRDGRNATAIAKDQEFLLPEAPKGITEGASFYLEVAREKIPGLEPWKRALGRAALKPSFVGNEGNGSTVAMPTEDRLGQAGWNDIIEEARSGTVRFAGGELTIFVTPAMTLIDVDGTLPPHELALAAARSAASAIRRHGIAGSIGIDFPTVAGKALRNDIGAVFDEAVPKPFERTAVNGFGFLQIVRPRRHASLFELAQDEAPFEARDLLRRLGRGTGALRLVAHPAVVAVLVGKPDWLDALARQVGGSIGLRADSALPMSGGYAEAA